MERLKKPTATRASNVYQKVHKEMDKHRERGMQNNKSYDYIKGEYGEVNEQVNIAETDEAMLLKAEIVEHVLNRTKINVNAINEAGWTAMDIYFFVQNRQHSEELDARIEKLLRAAGARRQRQMLEFTRSPKQKKLMQTLMLAASLFATMAFQVGVNPPGGVWQEDTKEHQAGKAILAYKYPISYSCFMYFNTVGFLLCLALFLWLLMATGQRPRRALGWILPVMSLLAIMTTAFAYTYSIIVVSPKQTMAVTKTILVSMIAWAFVMLPFAIAIVCVCL
ncbi:hypothetical protein RHMOL_Rhmol01G0016800 [Rhododendron molle]|uniref:Uncharacterized protein n=1 Tax=Rhododendron molle TaxID=49168 RepID=A0ACC0PWV4_RHOML|nr:hypothetical protein RHMOL_Rhmol01G0016800 [Rhododendron molle]